MAAFTLVIGAMVYKSPSSLARYTYVLQPALVLIAAYGLAEVAREFSPKMRILHSAPIVGLYATILLGVMIVGQATDQLGQIRNMTKADGQVELKELSLLIDNDMAVLGTRSGSLMPYTRTNRLLSPKNMEEGEFVTYLSWPSEDEIQGVFEGNNVGWVLIRKKAKRWEVNYHVWLKKVTGELPSHPGKLRESDLVDVVFDGDRYILYRVQEQNFAVIDR